MKLKAVAGGRGGSWFVLMEGLARLIETEVPGVTVEVSPGGGVMNHALIGTGEFQMGILNPPMTVAALSGREPFATPFPDLRIGLRNLTQNHLHCCVERSWQVSTVLEWLDRVPALKVPVDRVGTVDRLVFQKLLDHQGTSETDLTRRGAHLVGADSYDDQLTLYVQEKVNSLWQFMGVPSPSITEAHRVRSLKTLAFPPGFMEGLEPLGWTASRLPPGSYGPGDEEVPTLAMSTTLGFHAQVDESVVYAITQALEKNVEAIRRIHPAARTFDPAETLGPGPGTLHPGVIGALASL